MRNIPNWPPEAQAVRWIRVLAPRDLADQDVPGQPQGQMSY